MPLPKKLDETVEAPSDGSLKNPVGNHWAIGGVGIWWPCRRIEERPLNNEEEKYLEHEWKYGGCMLWTSFNELSNSSTGCELGGARIAIQSDGPVHSGIDNQATVTMCSDITEHQKKEERSSSAI